MPCPLHLPDPIDSPAWPFRMDSDDERPSLGALLAKNKATVHGFYKPAFVAPPKPREPVAGMKRPREEDDGGKSSRARGSAPWEEDKGPTKKRRLVEQDKPKEPKGFFAAADDDEEDADDGLGFRAGREASDEEGGHDDDDDGDGAVDGRGKNKSKKKSKHAPAEAASNKPVSRFRQVVAVSKGVQPRDPRFDATAGEFSEKHFSKAYSFIGQYKDSEIEALKQELQKERKDSERRTELQALLTKMQQQRAQELEREHLAEVLRKRQQEEAAKVAAGLKQPYFLKKREIKEIAAVEKFKALEGSAAGVGAVDKALAKRRKKMVQKEKKRGAAMPTVRRSFADDSGGGGGGGGAGGGYRGGGSSSSNLPFKARR